MKTNGLLLAAIVLAALCFIPQVFAQTDPPWKSIGPAALNNARRELGDSVGYATSAAECASQVNVLVVAVPWKEFADLKPTDLKQGTERPTIIDCWRFLSADTFSEVADYISLGVGPAAQVAERVV